MHIALLDRIHRRPPRLEWVQLEVTSRCTAACTYCPRAAAGAAWEERDLPLELLDELLPSLAATRYVHLQGWGEPLLHPGFPEMVARLRAAGLGVGTTSNGVLLDRATARFLVEAGVEVVGLSAAGADSCTNDAVRRGSSLEQVVAAARLLREERAGRAAPRLHLAYMLLRSGLGSIARLPELVREGGFDEVVVSSLSLLSRPEQRAEALLADDRAGLTRLHRRLATIGAAVEAAGARIEWHLMSPHAGPCGCPENVQWAVFIGADGAVHPCVAIGLPVAGGFELLGWEGAGARQEHPLGRLGDRSLGEIWRAPASRSFRSRLLTVEPPAPCRRCIKRWGVPLHSERDLVPLV